MVLLSSVLVVSSRGHLEEELLYLRCTCLELAPADLYNYTKLLIYGMQCSGLEPWNLKGWLSLCMSTL